MANASAVIMALSLLINDVTLLYNPHLLNEKQFSTQMVYILSVCLLLYAIPMIPKLLWRRSSVICFLIEIAISLAILECSIVYAWKYIENYALANANEYFVQLTDVPDLERFLCQFCDGAIECPKTLAYLLLKMLSFALLLTVCWSINMK